MLNFILPLNDKYNSRCAEIFITQKEFLLFHCSECDEVFQRFEDLLVHLKIHYKNVEEHQEVQNVNEIKLPTATSQENEQLSIAYEALEEAISAEDSFERSQKNSYAIVREANQSCRTEDKSMNLENSLVSNISSPQKKKICKPLAITKSNNSTTSGPNSIPAELWNCNLCGFAFKEKQNLSSHLLRHNNQRNYACTQCPKNFFTRLELKYHEFRHNTERNHLCNHCGMGYVNSSSLSKHIKKHHSLQGNFKSDKSLPALPEEQHNSCYSCSKCSAIFKTRKALKNHLNLHENKFKYHCTDCNIGFSTEFIMNIHLIKLHGDLEYRKVANKS